MAECGEIGLLLGAFEDGELEPNEMQEVAFHLARCEACTGSLSAYSSLGRELRSIATEPDLAGFASAVKSRIDGLPVPLSVRIHRFLERRTDRLGYGFAWGSAIAAVAAVTIILITPYAEQYTHRGQTSVTANVAAAGHDPSPMGHEVAAIPEKSVEPVADASSFTATDSHADISRLESEIPSVAVWSEPSSDTTVIWLPDQP